jgi:prepilin signal peptidase PulO-like enzyme (type II secretory pathway)
MDITLVIIIGIVSGWVINYLADVLPVNRRFTAPVCVHCQAVIPWRDYFLFRECQQCHGKRSLRTWIVQILTPVTAVVLYFLPPARLGFGLGFGLLAFFGLVAAIDIEYRAILIPVNIAGAIIGVIVGITIRDLGNTILGGVVGFLVMLGIYYFGKFFNKMYGRIRHIEVDEVALGLGDVYLTGALGLMMGFPEVIGGLVTGVVIAGIASLIIIVISVIARRYKPLQAIPYAPFLILGAIIFLYIPNA